MESITKADEPWACEIVPKHYHIFSVLPSFLSRRRRRDAPDGNGSQKPLHCPSPGKDTEKEHPVKHSHTSHYSRVFEYSRCFFYYTCMMSMMTVRFLSWVGPSNFRTRFIKVILLHSINSSSPSWPLRTSSSFNNSATCWGTVRHYCYRPINTAGSLACVYPPRPILSHLV